MSFGDELLDRYRSLIDNKTRKENALEQFEVGKRYKQIESSLTIRVIAIDPEGDKENPVIYSVENSTNHAKEAVYRRVRLAGGFWKEIKPTKSYKWVLRDQHDRLISEGIQCLTCKPDNFTLVGLPFFHEFHCSPPGIELKVGDSLTWTEA